MNSRVYVISGNGTLINTVTYNDMNSNLMLDVVHKIEVRGWKYDNKGFFTKQIETGVDKKEDWFLYIDSMHADQDIWTKKYEEYPIEEFLKDINKRAAI